MIKHHRCCQCCRHSAPIFIFPLSEYHALSHKIKHTNDILKACGAASPSAVGFTAAALIITAAKQTGDQNLCQ